MIDVETMEALPIPKKGDTYRLPSWEKDTNYRATAWAYLNREDGGLIVEMNGKTYRLKQ